MLMPNGMQFFVRRVLHTSDTVMRLPELPATMIIVGGGYIAAELAHLFSSLGVGIRIVSQAGFPARYLRPGGLQPVHRSWPASAGTSAFCRGHRRAAARYQMKSRSRGSPPVTGELLLVAAGRVPDTASLDLDRAGVRLREDGRIEVDEFGRTTAEGIWSLGDASTPYPLKHVANAEARTLAHNLAFPDDLRPYPHDWVPSAVFTAPQIATVGAREQDLSHERPYVEAVKEYADVAYGWALQDNVGFCKLYADPATGTLLGAHIMGEQASLLIQPLIQAAATGQRLAHMARGQYWIHPALTRSWRTPCSSLELDPAARPTA